VKRRGNWKDTNPKDAVGIAKATFSTVPGRVMAEVGLAMLEGALKYGRHNYRVSGVRASVYYDAALRHLVDWWEGRDIDPESGIHHVTKAIAGLTVLRDSMLEGNLVDDRPPAVDPSWLAEFNAKAKALLEKYPSPKAAHTELSDPRAERLKQRPPATPRTAPSARATSRPRRPSGKGRSASAAKARRPASSH
jgi:hypothetical protein